MWHLTVRSTSLWSWSEIAARSSNPVRGRFLGVGGFMKKQNEVLLFSGISMKSFNPGSIIDRLLYRLDWTTLTWSAEVTDGQPPATIFASGTVLRGSVLVVYGGILVTEVTIPTIALGLYSKTGTWGYYNQVRTWVRYSTEDQEPDARFYHSVAASDERTIILYGGLDKMVYRNGKEVLRGFHDLWRFSLPTQNNGIPDLTHEKVGAQWQLLSKSGPNTSSLASLVSIENVLYLFDGADTTFYDKNYFEEKSSILTIYVNCSSNLWSYNLTDGSEWQIVPHQGNGPKRLCWHNGFRYGDRMLIVGGCANSLVISLNIDSYQLDYDCPNEKSVWVYDPPKRSWLHLSSQPVNRGGITGSATFILKDIVISLCGLPSRSLVFGQIPNDWTAFAFYRPGCPSGTTSINLRSQMCYSCPKGSYSPMPRSNCSKCPDGLTTAAARSTAQAQCSQCTPGYCKHGSCSVTSQLTPSCLCKDGFTRDIHGLCTIATYYYIGTSAVVAGLAMLLLIILLIMKFTSARKRHGMILRNKEQELIELTNTWNIDSREVRLRRRIDRDSPGGYGEVYQAEYREMTVAVKKLQGIHQQIDRIELEFEREIEVMRTIRHPNIVLFLGGGRYHDDGCPFLMVEYMPRGSLATILKNDDITLDDSFKIRFALDAAKGMRFLHSLRPPRIHRDLKSSNLLVSGRWVVKVADFGAARLVKHEGVNQEAVRGQGPLDPRAPLLHADYQLSSDIGTPFWCAPEVLCGEGYGTPADVYSFGIVMWEIWWRKVPYHDHCFRFMSDLASAVSGGLRPTIAGDEQNDYLKSMRTCWSGNTSCRPSFSEIVVTLERISELILST
jgi:hypothetical protein